MERTKTSQRHLDQQGERRVQPVWRNEPALRLLTAVYAQAAKEGRHVAEPTRSSGYSAELKPPSASQRQEQYSRDLRKYPSVNQLLQKAAAAQPEGLQSQDLQQEGVAIQSEDDTNPHSEDEEDFEEREDDRANDPACIQCDDGGALLTIPQTLCFGGIVYLWQLSCASNSALSLTVGNVLVCVQHALYVFMHAHRQQSL